MRRLLNILTVCALCAGCKTSPEPLPTEFESAPLLGMVYSIDNRPIQGMTIIIDDQISVESDIEGRFIFAEVPRGSHEIVARKVGYESIVFSFDFNDRTQVLHLQTLSSEELLHRFENAIEQQNWNEVDALSQRIGTVGELRKEYLFLAAIADFIRGNRAGVQTKVTELVEAGIQSIYVGKLLTMSSDEAMFDLFRSDILAARLNTDNLKESDSDSEQITTATDKASDEVADDTQIPVEVGNSKPASDPSDDANRIFGDIVAPPAEVDQNDQEPTSTIEIEDEDEITGTDDVVTDSEKADNEAGSEDTVE